MERLHLGILLLFLTVSLFSQGYIDETSKWKEYHYEWGASPSVPDLHEYSVYIYSKDTLINNLEYQIIDREVTRVEAFYSSLGLDTVSLEQYHQSMFIREDDSKWYQLFPQGEELILDFNYEVGDTIHYDWFYSEHYVISRIEEFEFADEVRKKFIVPLRYSHEFVVYEGIGSSRGFLLPFLDASFEGSRRLECHQYKDETIILDTRTDNCEIGILSNIEPRPDRLSINVYPNPLSDILNIQLDEVEGKYAFEIFDLNGKRILEGRSEDMSDKRIRQIDIRHLSEGAYILVVRTAEAIFRTKLIKQ